MSFEPVFGTIPQKNTELLARNQIKVDARVDLKTAPKKVLCVSANCFVNSCERVDTEIKVTGKVVTRVIYIDEFDAYNSEENNMNFTEKFNIKNANNLMAVTPSCYIVETGTPEVNSNIVDVQNLVEIALMGVTLKELRYVTDIRGDADAKRETISFSTWSRPIEERFTVDDRFDLDKNCDGVLGVDAHAAIESITCNDNRVIIKGVIAANVIGVKSGEGTSIYNNCHELDFSKSFNISDINIDDCICGHVGVANVNIKAENKSKPELVIEVDLVFYGQALSQTQIEFVTDAVSFENELVITRGSIESSSMLCHTTAGFDIEGNIMMPEGSPYISKILSVSGSSIASINIVPADNKMTVEGVMNACIVYECDEKLINTHAAQIPFSASIKIDGMSAAHNVQATIHPMCCDIKARRGRELLVDANIGISLNAVASSSVEVISDIQIGNAKVRDDCAIIIYVVQEKQTLWDIAKHISVPSTEIIKQNPAAATVLNTGDRILIYRQSIINF